MEKSVRLVWTDNTVNTGRGVIGYRSLSPLGAFIEIYLFQPFTIFQLTVICKHYVLCVRSKVSYLWLCGPESNLSSKNPVSHRIIFGVGEWMGLNQAKALTFWPSKHRFS